jgi:lysophospholipase L1-like esterase
MKRFLLPFFLLLFLLPQGAWADTHYVATTGNDTTGDGTSGNPWFTPQHALIANRLACGDVLELAAGTYASFEGATKRIDVVVSGTGTVTIQAASGATVNIDIPSDTQSGQYFMYFGVTSTQTFKFVNINFRNPNNIALRMLVTFGANLTLENCSIDFSSSVGTTTTVLDAQTTYLGVGGSGKNPILLFDRVIFTNMKRTNNWLLEGTSGDCNPTVTFQSCKFVDCYTLYKEQGSPDFLFVNNTVYRTGGVGLGGAETTPYQYPFYFYEFDTEQNASTKIKMKNNIFGQSDGGCLVYLRYASASTAQAQIAANRTLWDVTNNWVMDTGARSRATYLPLLWVLGDAASTNSKLIYMDKTNKMFDATNALFTNAPTTLTVSSTMLNGTGSAADLPANGPLGGGAWTGNDVGCYPLPGAGAYNWASTLTDNAVAAVGDSIMNGGSGVGAGNLQQRAYKVLQSWRPDLVVYGGDDSADYGSPIGDYPNVAQSGVAFNGMRVAPINWVIDRVVQIYHPKYVILSIGVNNTLTTDTYGYNPGGATNGDIANEIMSSLDRIASYGMTPIWIGLEYDNSGHTDTQESIADAINALVDAYCETKGYVYDNQIARFRFNSNWKVDYYDNRPAGNDHLHPDADGNIVLASIMDTALRKATNPSFDHYWVSTAGTSTAPGTFNRPITIAGLNAVSVIPIGESGRVVNIMDSTGSTFTPVNDGSAGKMMKLRNKANLGGWNFTGMNYWMSLENFRLGTGPAFTLGTGAGIQGP